VPPGSDTISDTDGGIKRSILVVKALKVFIDKKELIIDNAIVDSVGVPTIAILSSDGQTVTFGKKE
jgi:hypothetical protein